MLTRDGCTMRQKRFRTMLRNNNLDAAVITDHREINYLTGFLTSVVPVPPMLLFIETEGGSWLGSHPLDGEAFVDGRDAYELHKLGTVNPDLARRLVQVVDDHFAGGKTVRRLGWQSESLSNLLASTLQRHLRPDAWTPIDDQIAVLEKRKDPDEVALMRQAIRCSLAAYDAGRAIIAPGVNELAVLEAGHTAATLTAKESIFHSGDYRCGEPGGFARNRGIQAGELYVIDAWSIYHGYWSDLCRTFPVSEPTALQIEVQAHIAEILTDVPNQLKPAVSGTALWGWMDRRLREHPHLRATGLTHHAGHGVGLRAHEAPDLNRDRDGILEPGVVVSVEPGAYSPELNAGIRLENTFLITDTGCELLSAHPLV
jgi:Xaa-Pro aminopeptidase